MRKPLIVRLPNWVGDVVMTVPALRLLSSHGYAMQLVGKRWAGPLLEGEQWPLSVHGRRWRERVTSLKVLAAAARSLDPDFDRRCNAIVFPKSLSSAWEVWCAGLKGVGFRADGRSWLLHRALPLPHAAHQLQVYWQLVTAFLGSNATPPARIELKLTSRARGVAAQLLATHGLQAGYMVLCPFSQGLLQGQPKSWPQFEEFAARLASQLPLPVLICPGPGEQLEARRYCAHAKILEGVDLDVYAALLQGAAAVVANDTGPGHLAAAVGAPLLSVLGPTDPSRYAPWGSSVQVLRADSGWPTVDTAITATLALLAPPPTAAVSP
jgi:heptosyltransferase II